MVRLVALAILQLYWLRPRRGALLRPAAGARSLQVPLVPYCAQGFSVASMVSLLSSLYGSLHSVVCMCCLLLHLQGHTSSFMGTPCVARAYCCQCRVLPHSAWARHAWHTCAYCLSGPRAAKPLPLGVWTFSYWHTASPAIVPWYAFRHTDSPAVVPCASYCA